ncbi:MAG: hypothetical protein R3246_14355 [Acidimicrobiia bacterium]|nr:hypothetical protein [Acidimicrobiia bacterium]
MKTTCTAVLATLMASVVAPVHTAAQGTPSDWPYFGGDRAFTRYAPLDRIDRNNVDSLEILWRRSAVDPQLLDAFPDLTVPANLRSTPILLDGVLYAPDALGLVEAFDPGTGATIWRQRPFDASRGEATGRSSRGVDFWRDDDEVRVLAVRGAYLYALDAETGDPIPTFGVRGRVDLVPESGRSSCHRCSPSRSRRPA